MIFVTVGTHEQSFDRLLMAVDQYAVTMHEETLMQTGYGSFVPKSGKSFDFLDFDEMIEELKNSEVVITHGGPGSIMLALEHGKCPIVAPRMEKYQEHVNNHQVEFCRFVSKRNDNVFCLEDFEELDAAIEWAKGRAVQMDSPCLERRRSSFIQSLSNHIEDLMK